MKKSIRLLVALAFSTLTSFAQVGIGTTSPNPNAALELESSSQGMLFPRMTTTQRNVINAPAEGLTIFNTTDDCLQTYTGTWDCVTAALTTQVASNGTGGTYTFLDHNLGADTSLDPHTPVVGLQGAYIQWGKRGPNTTGDSTLDWKTAANDGSSGFAAAPTASAANDAAISDWSQTAATNGSWNVDENSPVKVTANDPCPTGYRVPTRIEWTAVNTNNTLSRTGAAWSAGPTEFGNALHYGPDVNTKRLTLPVAGGRNITNGALFNRGNNGRYWSSTENDSSAYFLFFNSNFVLPANTSNRTLGFSVRCIAE